MDGRPGVGAATSHKKQFDWGRVAEMLIPFMIAWAFYTTFQGAVEFQNQGKDRSLVDYIGAAIGALMILTPLALTSWLLGADLAARMIGRQGARRAPGGRTVLVLGIFVVVFSASVFFTFNFYSQKRFSSDSNRLFSKEQPQQMRDKVVSPLIDELNASYAAQSTALNKSPGVSDYETSLQNLLSAVQRNGGQDLQKIVAERDKARSEIEASIKSKTTEMARLKALFKDAIKEIDDRTADLKIQNANVFNEEHGAGKRKAGRGPEWFAARAKVAEDSKRIAELKGILKANGIDALELAIKKEEDQLAQLPQGGGAANRDDISKVTTLLGQLQKDPRWGWVPQAEPPCLQIVEDLKRLGDKGPKLSTATLCAPTDGAARAALTEQQARFEALEKYKNDCGEGGKGDDTLEAKLFKLKTDIAAASGSASLNAVAGAKLEEAKKLIDECVRKSGALGLSETSQQKYLDAGLAFYNENARDKDRFQVAASDLRNGRFDAWLALLYAFVQDAFILVLKMLADIFGAEAPTAGAANRYKDLVDRAADAPELRARKAIVREAIAGRRGGKSLVDLASLPLQKLPDEVRAALSRLLNRLVRENRAGSLGNGAFEIDNGVIDRIEEDLPDFEPSAAEKDAAYVPSPPQRGARPGDDPAQQRPAGESGTTFWDRYFN